jgi:hypothetical protein
MNPRQMRFAARDLNFDFLKIAFGSQIEDELAAMALVRTILLVLHSMPVA